jgi:chloramphenicol 3-O phosphotransferase
MAAPGTVVILDGPSSAGKTTLTKATRERLGATCMAVSLDRLFAFAHPAHPLNWRLFATLTDATFAIAVTAATAGFDVIVDTVFERRDCFASACRAFASTPHFYVAVTCSLDELEAREQARGDRPPGLARRQHVEVFHDTPYALELDTSRTTVEQCAEQIAQLCAARIAAISGSPNEICGTQAPTWQIRTVYGEDYRTMSRRADGTSWQEMAPVFFQPSLSSHVLGWYTTSGS